MTYPLWQPSNPPSHSPDFRLAIKADFARTSILPPSPPPESFVDDEKDFYTAYATGLGWLPAPE